MTNFVRLLELEFLSVLRSFLMSHEPLFLLIGDLLEFALLDLRKIARVQTVTHVVVPHSVGAAHRTRFVLQMSSRLGVEIARSVPASSGAFVTC